MWEITSAQDGQRIFVVGIGETFEGLSDEEKKIVFDSANYVKRRVELELAQRIGEIGSLARSLTFEEWSTLPEKVYDFLLPYAEVENDDD